MAKKYQVFISSTYTDLIDERRAVEETIIRAGDIPVGMEAFPAADEEQFDFIKSVIDQCDYYVLIVAGRYGSLAPDGLSYTEKEYHYAVEKRVPVLVMLREDRGRLPQQHYEHDEKGRELLEAFIEKVSTGRIRKCWSTTDGLKLAVREALDFAKATKIRPGWVRGDQVSSTVSLQKLIDLQEENDRLTQELDERRPAKGLPENVAGLDHALVLEGTYEARKGSTNSYVRSQFSFETSFGEVFALIAPKLLKGISDSKVNEMMAKAICENKNGFIGGLRRFQVLDELFDNVKIQLMALGVVRVRASRSTQGNILVFWRLTESGEQEMFRRRVATVE
ncbi:DUF4062 domain-containing protein [Leisingera sp. M527]|uniref:DUF4062 domain-containing protein n=1 Tax=Leisingera sp. M527 TaxID=2867014 RepID=UPI0021A8915F|nr:DUF4062 domain-containing protein [Leisingera sp. M527]UWQ33180.1 DUF4062 domain-containing protein [Leisingera sp. M527]